MRARNIKPGFYENEILGTLSPLAHLLFPYLWMAADHEGRMEYRPLRMKAQAFPYRDADVAALCDELESDGFIRRYGGDGGDHKYLVVLNFRKHQYPCKKERDRKSEYPDPNQYGTVTVPDPNQYGTGSADILNTDILNTDILNTDPPPTEESEGEEEAPQLIPPILEEVRAAWNTLAAETGFRPCRSLGPKRKAALRERLRDADWRQNWPAALEAMRGIGWMRGKNARGWIANFDFFLRPETLNKLLEGSYGDTAPPQLSCKDPDDSAGLF